MTLRLRTKTALLSRERLDFLDTTYIDEELMAGLESSWLLWQPIQAKTLEEQNQNNLTAEELKVKQQKAEERRQNILEEKCRIARQAQKMFSKNDESLQNEDGEEKENKAS
ncbi:hypothetical protein TNCV_1897971 [Trichonephila clavipes]|uniref:Uncharacterized protein n=1 Tax=Trichonephila clavipes TaxID=2585209 RepID=A0A8X7BJB4_TRICX|nr:hypothetical protein TNCV_1897971 [Trichonephila clavipes]